MGVCKLFTLLEILSSKIRQIIADIKNYYVVIIIKLIGQVSRILQFVTFTYISELENIKKGIAWILIDPWLYYLML